MIGRCGLCKYWGVREQNRERYTVCERVLITNAPPARAGVATGLIYAEDDTDNGLLVEFRTGPAFGCTRFEPA